MGRQARTVHAKVVVYGFLVRDVEIDVIVVREVAESIPRSMHFGAIALILSVFPTDFYSNLKSSRRWATSPADRVASYPLHSLIAEVFF